MFRRIPVGRVLGLVNFVTNAFAVLVHERLSIVGVGQYKRVKSGASI